MCAPSAHVLWSASARSLSIWLRSACAQRHQWSMTREQWVLSLVFFLFILFFDNLSKRKCSVGLAIRDDHSTSEVRRFFYLARVSLVVDGEWWVVFATMYNLLDWRCIGRFIAVIFFFWDAKFLFLFYDRYEFEHRRAVWSFRKKHDLGDSDYVNKFSKKPRHIESRWVNYAYELCMICRVDGKR